MVLYFCCSVLSPWLRVFQEVSSILFSAQSLPACLLYVGGLLGNARQQRPFAPMVWYVVLYGMLRWWAHGRMTCQQNLSTFHSRVSSTLFLRAVFWCRSSFQIPSLVRLDYTHKEFQFKNLGPCARSCNLVRMNERDKDLQCVFGSTTQTNASIVSTVFIYLITTFISIR